MYTVEWIASGITVRFLPTAIEIGNSLIVKHLSYKQTKIDNIRQNMQN